MVVEGSYNTWHHLELVFFFFTLFYSEIPNKNLLVYIFLGLSETKKTDSKHLTNRIRVDCMPCHAVCGHAFLALFTFFYCHTAPLETRTKSPLRLQVGFPKVFFELFF